MLLNNTTCHVYWDSRKDKTSTAGLTYIIHNYAHRYIGEWLDWSGSTNVWLKYLSMHTTELAKHKHVVNKILQGNNIW